MKRKSGRVEVFNGSEARYVVKATSSDEILCSQSREGCLEKGGPHE
jgi:hypothetical protein